MLYLLISEFYVHSNIFFVFFWQFFGFWGWRGPKNRVEKIGQSWQLLVEVGVNCTKVQYEPVLFGCDRFKLGNELGYFGVV